MKIAIQRFLSLWVLFGILSCGGGGSDTPGSTPTPSPTPEATAPKAATLVFPENNTTCNEGAIVNDAVSKVNFQWNAAEDTDSYELRLKNLDTDVTTVHASSASNTTIDLDRGVPYSWFVKSKSNTVTATATSATWKFYNQGPGVESYAPFPAEVVSPVRGSTISGATTVSLVWTGSDVDEDIASYEVYVGTIAPPTNSVATTSATTTAIEVEVGKTYYWRVKTIDETGQNSLSELFEFKVK